MLQFKPSSNVILTISKNKQLQLCLSTPKIGGKEKRTTINYFNKNWKLKMIIMMQLQNVTVTRIIDTIILPILSITCICLIKFGKK